MKVILFSIVDYYTQKQESGFCLENATMFQDMLKKMENLTLS